MPAAAAVLAREREQERPVELAREVLVAVRGAPGQRRLEAAGMRLAG